MRFNTNKILLILRQESLLRYFLIQFNLSNIIMNVGMFKGLSRSIIFFLLAYTLLYRQNKQRLRSESGISESLAEESIILTIGEGEQIEDSPLSMPKQGVPDDSLDAYIS